MILKTYGHAKWAYVIPMIGFNCKKKINKGINLKSITLERNSHDFSFKNFISKDLIYYLASDCERFRVFDPSSTLFCFLFQVFNSCSAKSSLLNFNVQRAKLGLKTVSMNTAAFIKAKKRLSEVKLKNITTEVGKQIDKKSTMWKFKGRDVYLGDGTVINLQDNNAIKKMFPVNLRKGKRTWTT